MRRIIAIGDIHGAIGSLLEITQRLGLVDGSLDLAAEGSDLIFIGDLCDRGANSKDIYELVMRWQEQAPRLDSGVWFLIGNHEAMNIFGMRHYTTPEEYLSYDGESVAAGERARAGAFAPGGWLYEWLVRQRAMLKLGGFIFAHGDLPPTLASWTVEEIDSRVMEALRLRASGRGGELPAPLFSPEQSVLWCRDAQGGRGRRYAAVLRRFLAANNATGYICGHTPSEDGLFHLRHGGRYLCIDTAMTFECRGIGRKSALFIEEDHNSYAAYFTGGEVVYHKVDLAFESLSGRDEAR